MKAVFRLWICAAVAAVTFAACKNNDSGGAVVSRADSAEVHGTEISSGPATFWDNVDFINPAIVSESALIEQKFADFAALLAGADPELRDYSVRRLLARAAASESAYSRILEIAEHYLFDPASPMYSEEDYIPFMEYRLAHPKLGKEPENVEKLEYSLDMAGKNTPGSQAPDFSFETRSGQMRSLMQPGSKAEILLIFYGPDCERCAEAVGRLRHNVDIAKAIAGGELRVVLVYPGDDREQWLSHAAGLPSEWEVGIDANRRIDRDELYWVRATPSAYILTPSLTVLGKNVAL